MIDKLTDVLKPNVGKIFPGAAFAVVTPGRIAHNCVGDATPMRFYDIASLTKVIATDTVIAKLVEADRLSFSDPLSKYLPEYAYLDYVKGEKWPLTIAELLSHQSALLLPDIKEEMKALYAESWELAHKRCLDNLADTKIDPKQLISCCGRTTKKIQYANVNFILLGNLAEKIYGRPFDEIVKSEVLAPLSMNDSHFNCQDDIVKESAYAPTEPTDYRGTVCGRVHDENAFFLGGVSGNAGLFSTIWDVSLFARMLISEGYTDKEKFVSDKTLAAWFKPVNKKRTLGWEYHAPGMIKHTGFTGTYIFANRNTHTAVVILTNRVNYGREDRSIYELYDIVSKMFSQ